jgi:hypothetical protein
MFSDGSQTDVTDSVNWSSNATGVSTVDPTGLASGLSAGAAMVSAASGTATPGAAALTVTTAVLTEVDIAPDAQYIPVGGQLQLSLTGTYSDGSTQDITANASWSSSDTTLASVDPGTGIVTGIANSNNNSVTITATYGGVSNTTTVYITDAVPVSVQLTPATASIATGTTQQYAVDVVYSDGSLQPVTRPLYGWFRAGALGGFLVQQLSAVRHGERKRRPSLEKRQEQSSYDHRKTERRDWQHVGDHYLDDDSDACHSADESNNGGRHEAATLTDWNLQ